MNLFLRPAGQSLFVRPVRPETLHTTRPVRRLHGGAAPALLLTLLPPSSLPSQGTQSEVEDPVFETQLLRL